MLEEGLALKKKHTSLPDGTERPLIMNGEENWEAKFLKSLSLKQKKALLR